MMSDSIKLRAVVLKESNKGESNKQIIVLAKEHGKMLLSATGARNIKSKFLAGTQLFSYCDFFVTEKKGFYYISEIDLIESFYDIRLDIQKLSYSIYFLELIEKTAFYGMECDEVLELLLRTLFFLSKKQYDVTLAAKIFELKHLQLSGYMLETKQCVFCGKISEKTYYFTASGGGILCEQCKKKVFDTIPVSVGSVKAVEFILSSDIKNIFQFQVSDFVSKQLSHICDCCIKTYINLEFETLKFAQNLDKLEMKEKK